VPPAVADEALVRIVTALSEHRPATTPA